MHCRRIPTVRAYAETVDVSWDSSLKIRLCCSKDSSMDECPDAATHGTDGRADWRRWSSRTCICSDPATTDSIRLVQGFIKEIENNSNTSVVTISWKYEEISRLHLNWANHEVKVRSEENKLGTLLYHYNMAMYMYSNIETRNRKCIQLNLSKKKYIIFIKWVPYWFVTFFYY